MPPINHAIVDPNRPVNSAVRLGRQGVTGVYVLEHCGAFGEGIDVWTGLAMIAVAAQVIGAQCVYVDIQFAW